MPTKSVGSSRETKNYLFGGDQLTCARARSAKRHQQDSATAVERMGRFAASFLKIGDCTNMCLFEVRMLMVLL